MQYSVFVLNYNRKLEQIFMTLDSIMCQKNVSFEIIYCDDGSKQNYFEEIEKYFSEKAFENYVLCGDGINRGTVKNILRGLDKASGRYAKLIGAGDALYDENTLYDVMNFMKSERTECCFGRTQGYITEDGERKKRFNLCPRDIAAYRTKNRKRIVRNIIVAEDWVSGVAVFATINYYRKYISMLEDRVIYCEDYAIALALLDHVFMKLYDKNVVWYETSDGISTAPNPEFRRKLMKDNMNLWALFDKKCEEDFHDEFSKYIKRRKKKKKYDNVQNKGLQMLLKAIAVPELLLFEKNARKQYRKEKDC